MNTEHNHAADPARLETAERCREFILGGNATVTVKSVRTGQRYTYKVRASDDGSVHFVSLMNGPDNEDSFAYFGFIKGGEFIHGGRKAKVQRDTPSAAGFAWVWKRIAAGLMPEQTEIWHEGRCGRCGRKLTVPESIESGFGPECITRIGRAA
jgi:hypothetical protein